MSAPRAGLLDQCNALAAFGISWRIVLPDGASRKIVVGQIGRQWYPMPEGSWSVREFRSAVYDGVIEPLHLICP